MPQERSSSVRSHLAALAALLLLLGATAAPAAQELPVFLADNHAETFGWIARSFDPDKAHLMVLVDAHSDASAVERSDELREELRRVPSARERDARIERWRTQGRLQAFNWIEPLMPRPVDRVMWLAAPSLAEEQRGKMLAEAIASVDGRLEVEPRSAGSFDSRWEIRDLSGFAEWNPGRQPVILAIDLDFFAGMKAADREKHFEAIWRRAMDWPGLEGVAFAVSRPWLTDDAEATALVSLAVDAARRTRGARLEIDASLDDRPDHSLQAAELGKHRGAVPRWDLATAEPALKAQLTLLGDRLRLSDRRRPGDDALLLSTPQAGHGFIAPQQGQPDCDGVWRFAVGEEPVLQLSAPAEVHANGRVRWYRLEPARSAYDLLPGTGLGKDFAQAPARWIYESRRALTETTDFLLSPAAWRQEGGGQIRLEAEYETADHQWLPAPPVELRGHTAAGFRGALSECRGMPYVFGIAGVAEAGLSGVETGWGSDCGNLLAYAWRRNGLDLSWGDPGRLRQQLVTRASDIGIASGAKIEAGDLEQGLAIDFGRHMAALWEDREPVGVLDGGDRVMHHLGGFPEILPLAELAAKRPVFSLRTPRPALPGRVALAGDVVLAGGERQVIEGFSRQGADLLLANLEGIPSLHAPDRKPRFDFRFPAERLAWLKERGVSAVSLANNHALDAGTAGLLEGIRALTAAGIPCFGAGADQAAACRPWLTEVGDQKLAVFGVSCFPEDAAGPDRPGTAVLPDHAELLDAEIAEARKSGARVIVMIHGGQEYRREVSDDQRRWARWLVARGVALVVGAHPHVLQAEECHGGATIYYSLGNAVYPAELSGAGSGAVRFWSPR